MEKEGEKMSGDVAKEKQELGSIMRVEMNSGQQSEDLEDLSIVVTRRASIARILIKYSLAWARYSLARLPIRMTLSNLGILAVVLAIVLPRSITYMLLYPIFRLVFGNLYPAYASYKAVRTKNVKEYVKWMMYWIVFALFTCAETFTDVFFSFWFPFYYEIKTILVFWLLSPATKGSSILYRRFVHPALIRREAEIDEALARATEQGYTAVLHLGTKGVNYATTVLMQTAIKGGGGLVQHLRKSYSLSDLTGEKEDENRNTPDTHDETDMEVEPRRREHVGRRSYSPRRTQSSSNRVEMYFSEVDVDVRQPRPREPIVSLTNIRSSDDISSGYSSGEALQSHRTTQGDSLVRTASVGARTRAKPRSTTKKTPEDAGEDSDCIDLPSSKNISFPSPLNLVTTPDQALEFLLLLSQNSTVNEHIKFGLGSPLIGNDNSENTSQSGPKINIPDFESKRSDTECVQPALSSNVQKSQDLVISKIPESLLTSSEKVDNTIIVSIDTHVQKATIETDTATAAVPTIEEVPSTCSLKSSGEVSRTEVTDELCQNKFDELKQLLSDAHKAVNSIVHSQEKLKQVEESVIDISVDKKAPDGRTCETDTGDSLQKSDTCNVGESSKLDNDSIAYVDALDVDDKTILSENDDRTLVSDTWATPNVSRSNSDSLGRAGKYNKKPAPKVPLTTSNENLDETESQSALKATLVIKTGTLKTFSNTSVTKDVFFAQDSEAGKSKGKKSKKQRTKEGFSKLLTIPKNIFHSAFHKEHKESGKADDSSSVVSEMSDSVSRSNSIASQDVFVELSTKLSDSNQEMHKESISDERANEIQAENTDINAEHISDSSVRDATTDKDIENNENCKENAKYSPDTSATSESQIEHVSQSPKPMKRIVSDIY